MGLYNPLKFYPRKKRPLELVSVHLPIVSIVCTDWSFDFLKIIPAFWLLLKEQLFKSAIVISVKTSVKIALPR